MLGKAGTSQVTGSGFDANGTQVGPSQEDSNGNEMTWASGGVDSLGRTLVTLQRVGNQGTYSVKDSSGTVQTYVTNFDPTYAMDTALPDEPGSGSGVLKQYMQSGTILSSVVLPNGRSYVFKYDQPTPFAYGNIVEIDLPTGAVITYAWNTFENGDFSYSRKVTDRTVTVGSQQYHWHFAYTISTVTVTDPLNNQSVYTVHSGAVSNVAVYQGTATGNPIRNYKMDYVTDATDPMVDPYGPAPDPQTTQYLPGNRLIRITSTLDDGKVSKREFDYETFNYTFHPRHTALHYTEVVTFTTSRGNVTETREYDYGATPGTYGSGVPGALLRRADKTYLHNSNTNYVTYNIVDKVLQNTIFDGAGNQKAQTQYEYDTTALSSSGGAPQHDATYTTSFTFRGNVSRVKRWRNTDGALLATTYTYDDLGNIVSISDPLTHMSTYDYTDSWSGTTCPPPSNSHAYVTTFANALSQQIKRTYFPCTGLLQAHKDPNDIAAARAGTTYLYDLFGRVTQKSLPDGGQINSSYNDVPPVTQTSTTKVNSSLSLVSVATQDGLGRVTNTQITSDPDGTTSVDTAYDAFGRTSSVSNPHRSAAAPTDGTTTYLYDALGRTKQITRPDGAIVSTSYTSRATDVLDEGNGVGRVERVSQVDGLGRLVSVCEVTSTTLLGGGGTPGACGQDITKTGFLTAYTYDILDNLLTATQGTLPARTFTYDSLSQLATAINPESATTSYSYDADGNATQRTRPAPNQFSLTTLVATTYAYDALNRLTGISYNDGSTAPVANTYDQTSAGGFTFNNPVGRLTTESRVTTQGTSKAYFSYDSMGRITNQWQCTPLNCGSSTLPMAYSYDLAGNVITANNGAGLTLTYNYSGANRLLGVTSNLSDGNHPPFLLTNVVYNPLGKPSSDTVGSLTFETYAYNNRGWLNSFLACSVSGGSCTAPQTVYTFNMLPATGSGFAPNGNILYASDSANGIWTYSYDDLNRLKTGVSTNGQGCSWEYDRYGNRWHQNAAGGSCFSSQLSFTGTSNRPDGYSYDAAGNLLNDLTHGYTYDAENRIIQVSGGTATYVYDARGRRVSKTSTAGTFDYLYDTNGQQIGDVGSAGWHRGEVYANGRHLATYRIGTTFFNFSDWLGTERARTAVSGTNCETITSLPFGDGQSTSGVCADAGPIHFTGKERDAESGLDNFGARYDASSLGRFMSPDPKQPSIKHLMNPQKWNKYAYVLNNPLSLVDPDGLEEITVQLRAYIPQASVGPYRGDNRGPTASQSVTSRTSITMRIETDPRISANPLLSNSGGQAGVTHNDLTGNSATQTQGLPNAQVSRDANGNVVINIKQDAPNPLTPQGMTPGIKSDLTVNVPVNGTSVTRSGTVSGSPAFELNVGTPGNDTTNIPLQGASGNSVMFVIGLTQTNKLPQTTTPLPAPRCTAGQSGCSQ
jgi:RHS repeat-associated protein